MIRIKVGSEDLDLSEKFRVRIRQKSPLFSKNTIPALFTQSFSLEETPRNIRLLGNRSVHQAAGPHGKSLAVTFILAEVYQLAGTLKIHRLRGGQYQCSLTAVADRLQEIKDDTLASLGWGGLQYVEEAYSYVVEAWEPDGDFALTPGSSEFVVSVDPAHGGDTIITAQPGEGVSAIMKRAAEVCSENPTYTGAGLFFEYYHRNGWNFFKIRTALESTITPNFEGSHYSMYWNNTTGTINTRLFRQHDYSGFATETMRKHELHANEGTADIYDYAFPALHSPGFITATFYGTGVQSFGDWINGTGSNVFDGNVIMPLVYVRAVLDKIAAAVGYTLAGDMHSDAELASLVLANNTPWNLLAEQPDGSYFAAWRSDIDVAEHLPNQTVNELLTALKGLPCLAVIPEPQTRTLRVRSIKSILQDIAPPIDISAKANIYEQRFDAKDGYTFTPQWHDDSYGKEYAKAMEGYPAPTTYTNYTDLPSPPGAEGLTAYISKEQNWYLSAKDDGGTLVWEWLSQDNLSLSVAPEASDGQAFTHTPTGSTLLNSFHAIGTRYAPIMETGVSGTKDIMAPYLGAEARAYGAADAERLQACHFLFYRGMVDSNRLTINSNAVEYAFATCESFNHVTETSVYWNYALRWDGTKGLYNVWWEPLYLMLAKSRQISLDYNIVAEELLYFDWTRKRHYRGLDYFISELDVQVTLQGIEACRLEAYQAP